MQVHIRLTYESLMMCTNETSDGMKNKPLKDQ